MKQQQANSGTNPIKMVTANTAHIRERTWK